jgi:hypothetical protein
MSAQGGSLLMLTDAEEDSADPVWGIVPEDIYSSKPKRP